MNNEHYPRGFERLEPPLDTAVQATLAEPIPEDAIERVKARAKQLAKSSTSTLPPTLVSHQHRGKGLRVTRLSLTVAAALLLATTMAILILDRSAGRAFARVIENVRAASSVRFATLIRFGQQPEINGQMYLEDDRMRLEQFHGMLIQVGDFNRKRALFLDVRRKLAQEAEIDADVARRFANPIDQLRQAKSNDAEEIGQEILNGRRTHVYRLSKVDLLGMKGGAEMLVWTDMESGLPAKILIRDTDPKAPMEIRFTEFVWNAPLDGRLFSLSIPDGFQPGVVAMAPHRSEPTEPNAPAPALVDGVLHNRVPARIVWGFQGTTITALMRDPESVPPLEQKPNELCQWDVTTGKLRWSEPVAGAGSVAGTADGKLLATVIGYEVQLRDAASGKVTQKWATDERLLPLAFSPDGRTLAAGITEWGPYGGRGGKVAGGVQLWDVEQSRLVRSIADDKPVTFLAYSSDGKSLATSSNEGPVKLWDTATGELVRMFPGRPGASFSPDGNAIAFVSIASSRDKTIGRVDLHNIGDGSLVKSFASEKGESTSYLLSVTFSPDGRLLAASDWNGTVTLWDVGTGELLKTIANDQAGVLCVAFAPDGATLALGSEDKTLRLWKLPAELIMPVREKR
jgi:hypothetical protein